MYLKNGRKFPNLKHVSQNIYGIHAQKTLTWKKALVKCTWMVAGEFWVGHVHKNPIEEWLQLKEGYVLQFPWAFSASSWDVMKMYCTVVMCVAGVLWSIW